MLGFVVCCLCCLYACFGCNFVTDNLLFRLDCFGLGAFGVFIELFWFAYLLWLY